MAVSTFTKIWTSYFETWLIDWLIFNNKQATNVGYICSDTDRRYKADKQVLKNRNHKSLGAKPSDPNTAYVPILRPLISPTVEVWFCPLMDPIQAEPQNNSGMSHITCPLHLLLLSPPPKKKRALLQEARLWQRDRTTRYVSLSLDRWCILVVLAVIDACWCVLGESVVSNLPSSYQLTCTRSELTMNTHAKGWF